MESLKNLNKPTRYKYKKGQMVYSPDAKSFGIVCFRSTRAYGIKEYYVKWLEEDTVADNYYLERELEYWVKEYDKVVNG